MPEGNCFQKVFDKNMCGPVKDMKVAFHSVPENTKGISDTVKTLYNVTRYNRIFNIRHKIAGNGSFSIKISSL